MKEIVIVCGQDCVYCKKAKMLVNRALNNNPKFKTVKIDYVMEDTKEGEIYQHKLVPAFFCRRKLMFEGNPDMKIVKSILDGCLE